jgi:PhzF family phenazine biosynthesis protein
MPRAFQLVDVFSDEPLLGNPLAVVFDAEGFSTERMQEITRWINLSETAFLLAPTSPDADYRVRIFTLDRELPFAGHPTLGSCRAWLEAGGRPRDPKRIVQECGAGLVPVRPAGELLAFAAPPLVRSGPVEESKVAELATFLRIPRSAVVAAEWADNGPGWIALLLESADAVLAVEPERRFASQLDLGIVGPYPQGAEAAFELRAFGTDSHGAVWEDPVTGSLNASVAEWLIRSGRARPPYVASQGARLGRKGRIRISQDSDGTLWIGGRATTVVAGELSLPG